MWIRADAYLIQLLWHTSLTLIELCDLMSERWTIKEYQIIIILDMF
jgi:hypothetical protein